MSPWPGLVEVAEEKTEFDVVITDGGANKIAVIKASGAKFRWAWPRGRRSWSKAVPAKVLEGVTKDAAETAKKKLEESGAKVELK